MSNNPCNGCGGAHGVFPFEYPYNRPARDSYGFCTCGDPRKNPCKPSADRCHPGPKPNPNHFPTSGPFIGNGLSLIETYPYLVDTTCLKYGQILSYSESVHTKVTRRNDTSCINLAANFDLTDTNLTNTVLNDFFKKYTAQKYDILEGVLPILKQHLIFKIYYTITDFDGGVLHQSVIRCGSDEMCFHFTDIRDMYVTSSKCLVVENIPAMTYNGMYTFTIDKVEAYMPMLDTKHFIQDGLNPFYQFVDNNMRIALQHELIENTPSESMVLIGETPVNASIDYRANITNRVRLSFVAFMSNVIAARDTVGIWEALNEPTDEIITQLRQEMTTLEETVRLMQNKIDAQDVKIHDLEGQVELNKNNIASHDRKIQHLESLVASYDGTFAALEARIYALEQRPLALVTYVEGKEFKTSQLTWKSYGQLYQCAKAFTASGDFNKDVGLGNLVPIAADSTDISAIEAELREVVETVNDAASVATEAANTVSTMADDVSAVSTGLSEVQEQVGTLSDTVGTQGATIEGLNTTVLALNEDIDELSADVEELKFIEESKTKVIITNTTTGERQLANSYGAAATVVKSAEDGSFTITCGEKYSQQTIAADTFKDATRLTEITFPASITTIASTAFDGCDGIIINIPKETDSVTGSPWGATNATINWNA